MSVGAWQCPTCDVLVETPYPHGALGRVYGATGTSRVVKAALLSAAAAGIVLGYRFALFIATLYATT